MKFDESHHSSSEDFSDNKPPAEVKINPRKRKHDDIPNKNKRKAELYKPPTVEELNSLKETENLYNNNLFRLQIEELLAEIRIKNKREKAISTWIKLFDAFLLTLPEFEIPLSKIQKPTQKNAKTVEKKLINTLAQYKHSYVTDQDIVLRFVRPAIYKKFGLYINNSLPGPNLIFNLNLVMPKSIFRNKDFLNNRYLIKRYYYLLYVLEYIRKTEFVASVALQYHEDNFLIPVLKVEPTGCDKVAILIYATPPDETFKPTRFLPDKNNVKQDVFCHGLNEEELKCSPTVLYNSSLAFDVTLCINNEFINDTLKDLKNLQDGIKLLCIWLTQRQLNVGLGSFSEMLVLYFVVYLFCKKKINKYMSSYQVVRNFWSFLSSLDLKNESISIAEVPSAALDSFKNYFDLVFLDKTGCYNLTAFLNKGIYEKVKAESQIALKCLDNGKNSSFQQLFLTKFPFHLQYEVIIDLSKSLPLTTKYNLKSQNRVVYVGYEHLLIINHILTIIQRALNKRYLNLIPRIEAEGKKLTRFVVGISLNPDEAFNILEMGPPLNDFEAAAEFREFWEHLSSDRRFRDGSTNVAVYFKTNTVKAKRAIVKKILVFVLEKLEMKYKIHYDEFEDVLVCKRMVPSYPSGTNEETTLKIIHASDELSKKLRALKMSLKITGVQGISEIFNFSEVFPPIPTNYKVTSATTIKDSNLIFCEKNIRSVPWYVQPITSVFQLEHSSKWPNDLRALRHIKTAFYLEIRKTLQSEHNIISHITPGYIEVFYEGLVFRYYLYVPKEVGLLKKVAAENGLLCYRESQESFALENKLNIMPKVMGALKGIQSIYPSFGPSTAIIKRWLRTQLIDDYYFPDIVISLLNASLYLDDTLVGASTPQASFLRFLKFFSGFDWNLQTVLVNFNDDVTAVEINELESKLQQNRNAYPNLYIIMPFDQGLSVFTKAWPTKEILHRVKQLVTDSLTFFESIILQQEVLDIKNLFVPNFDGYNILIHLNHALNAKRYEETTFSKIESRIVVDKYKESKEDKIPIVDFNPVEKYLSSLRENYGKYAMFFYDSYGGSVIGVLWNPRVNEIVDFKVSRVNAMKLVENKLCFNMDAVIEDFYILGKDLIKSIDKR